MFCYGVQETCRRPEDTCITYMSKETRFLRLTVHDLQNNTENESFGLSFYPAQLTEET